MPVSTEGVGALGQPVRTGDSWSLAGATSLRCAFSGRKMVAVMVPEPIAVVVKNAAALGDFPCPFGRG